MMILQVCILITTNLQEKFKKDVLSQAYTDFCNGNQNDPVYINYLNQN